MTASLALEREWGEESARHPASNTGWTMDRFVEWTFGPRRLAEADRLVRQIARGLERLLEHPDDESLRAGLVRWMMVLRDQADTHQWHAEADVAASLAERCSVDRDAAGLAREVRAGLRKIASDLRTRLSCLPASLRQRRRRGAGVRRS